MIKNMKSKIDYFKKQQDSLIIINKQQTTTQELRESINAAISVVDLSTTASAKRNPEAELQKGEFANQKLCKNIAKLADLTTIPINETMDLSEINFTC